MFIFQKIESFKSSEGQKNLNIKTSYKIDN